MQGVCARVVRVERYTLVGQDAFAHFNPVEHPQGLGDPGEGGVGLGGAVCRWQDKVGGHQDATSHVVVIPLAQRGVTLKLEGDHVRVLIAGRQGVAAVTNPGEGPEVSGTQGVIGAVSGVVNGIVVGEFVVSGFVGSGIICALCC